MPEEKKPDQIEQVLSDEKSLEGRKQALIDELLKQRAAAIADFDAKLEKLGYKANSAKAKRSHHKKAAAAPGKQKQGGEGGGKPSSPTVPQKKR
jgi:hypothetical protein